MFKLMLGFITGVILLYFSGDLINSSKDSLKSCVNYQIASAVLGLSLYACGFYYKKIQIKGLAYFFMALTLGLGYAVQTTEKVLSSRIPATFDQQIIQVTAYLCSLPKKGEYSFSADFCILDIQSLDGKPIPGEHYKARLNWPLDMNADEGVSLFNVKSRQARSTKNFIGTSFESNLFYQRIVLMGGVQSRIGLYDLSSMSLFHQLRYQYHQFRKFLSDYAKQLLVGTSHKGVIHALLLGDRSQLSPEESKVLASTGTQHLIAISGLHVGLVMGGLFFLLPRIALSIICVSMVGLVYVLLVGFTPSAQRAWIMCVCGLFYFSGYIKQSKWVIFLFALFLVLVLDPLATLNLGFWYSFLCVAIIFLVSQLIDMKPKSWGSLLFLQIILIVEMIPISSLLGTKHGVENIIANMLAIPWVSLIVLPFTLLWFFVSFIFKELSFYLVSILDGSIELLIAYLSSLKIVKWPFLIDTHVVVVGSFIIVSLTMLGLYKVKPVAVMCLLSLILVIFFPSRFYDDKSELMVFDVGQGLAMAINSKDKIWLYDTGPAYSKSSSMKNVILPYLRRHQKSNELVGLIVSHGDADHSGDIGTLYAELEPIFEWSGQPERLEVPGFDACTAGMIWQENELLIEVLYPFENIQKLQVSSNNQSCIVRLSFMGVVFLLMGDVESSAEMALVKYYRDELKADVLIAGHHGASQSSSFALLKHVRPTYIVFSAGYLNKFNHPSESVLYRVSKFDITPINTIESGAIKFSQSSHSLRIETAR